MSETRGVVGAVSSAIQFFPLSVFATYAFWAGVPTGARWVEAFQLAAVAAVVQLAILLPRRRPTNRLILGANLYLLVGGAAALGRQWWLLEAYGVLQETGIFLSIAGVGVVTTFATPAGFVAVPGAPRADVRRASLWLLGATLGAVAVALLFRGHRGLAAVAPVIALAVLQRVLASRLRTLAPLPDAATSWSWPFTGRRATAAPTTRWRGRSARAASRRSTPSTCGAMATRAGGAATSTTSGSSRTTWPTS
jgi:hypothetical protein